MRNYKPFLIGSLIIIIVILLIIAKSIKKDKTNENNQVVIEDAPTDFYSLNDSNQTNLIYAPKFDKDWFTLIEKKYSWDKFDPYDNKFEQYTNKLFYTIEKIAGDSVKGRDLFNSMTRGQKMYYCILTFNAEVSNGGVWQFFFNAPELCFATLETFEDLKLTQLKNDYEKCLNEFIGSSESYKKKKQIFNNNSISWNERWNAFVNGYGDIKTGQTIEKYFFKDDYQKYYYKTFVEYIDSHSDQFVVK